MKPGKFIAALILVIGCFCKPVLSQKSVLWGGLQKGTYEVGLRVIERFDTNRVIDSDSGKTYRPVQILVWYPAQTASTSKPLRYKDYISLISSEVNFRDSSDSDRKETIALYSRLLSSNGIKDDAIGHFLSTEMEAHENAKPVSGSFPCVVVGQGNFNPATNLSVLCEYLASHGYYVASTPSPMRITGSLTDTTQIYQYAVDQERDMMFATDELKTFKSAYTNKLAIIGYSFGGRAAFLMLNDVHNIKAFVSLDGGFADKMGKSWLTGIRIRTENISTPILHFYQDTETYIIPDFYLLHSLDHSDRYLVKIENMRHAFFSNMGIVVGVEPGIDFPGVKKDEVRRKFETICNGTLGFLNTFVKNEQNKYWESLIHSGSNSERFIKVRELKKKD